MAICTAIEKIGKIGTGNDDVLRVTIDNATNALWIWDYADAMQYLNQEVIVDYRQDIYKGNLTTFVSTFVMPKQIATLDKEDGIKLYVDSFDNNSNVSFREIADGDERAGCIVFCTKNEFRSSPKATWQEFIIRDCTMHIAVLRLFDYENKDADFSGKYIMCDLARSQYGFQASFVKPMDKDAFANPEIEIAKKYILSFFKNNEAAMKYMQSYNFMSIVEEVVDYEKGYALTRCAMELAMADGLRNITHDVDIDSICEAILCSRGHLLRPSNLSASYTNIALAIKIGWKNKVLVCKLLDTAADEHPAEYAVLQNIRSSVSTLLEVRKGTMF